MQLEIATGFYQSDSLPLAAQRCINWQPVVPQASALNQRALFDVQGIVTKSLTGATISGLNRGAVVVNEVPYFVNGNNLYSISSTLVVTDHGTIEGAKRVSLAHNGQFLVIVDPGNKSYVFDNETSILVQITDTDFIVSDTVSFKDGFFIFTATDGSVFFISELNDPLSYNALDFGSAEVRPDKIIASFVNHNELFILGEETIELFQNVGGADFPFVRVPGGDTQKGVFAKHSIIDFDNSFVFVGGAVNEQAAIWRMVGSAGVRKISTSAIDNAIQKFTKEEIQDAFAMTYAFGGNFFVAFTFASVNISSKTFVYDATTSALAGEDTWHERQTGVTDDKWRVTSIVTAFGELLVGDSIDGRIGEFDKDTHTEYGDVIFRHKASRPFTNDQTPAFVDELKLTMESGVGLIGEDAPQIRMDFSDDGGRTFGNEFWRTYGKIGRYERLPSWRRQGRVPRNRVVRFTTTENVRSNLLRLDAEGEAAIQL